MFVWTAGTAARSLNCSRGMSALCNIHLTLACIRVITVLMMPVLTAHKTLNGTNAPSLKHSNGTGYPAGYQLVCKRRYTGSGVYTCHHNATQLMSLGFLGETAFRGFEEHTEITDLHNFVVQQDMLTFEI